jgi:hypothetical protein
MNRHQKGTKRRRQILRLWTRAQALEALPYVRSIVRSLREHHLEVLRQRRDARRLADRPGRPGREALIAHQEALQGEARASQAFQHSLDELQSLDVYCLDPVRGEALIPFIRDEQLAWFVFDLFDDEPLRSWRFHSDPPETRRPAAELEPAQDDTTAYA